MESEINYWIFPIVFYLKHLFGPHFKGFLLATKLVPFSHLQHRFPAKFLDDPVKRAGERTKVWVGFGTQAENGVSENWKQ